MAGVGVVPDSGLPGSEVSEEGVGGWLPGSVEVDFFLSVKAPAHFL